MFGRQCVFLPFSQIVLKGRTNTSQDTYPGRQASSSKCMFKIMFPAKQLGRFVAGEMFLQPNPKPFQALKINTSSLNCAK